MNVFFKETCPSYKAPYVQRMRKRAYCSLRNTYTMQLMPREYRKSLDKTRDAEPMKLR